MTVTRSKTARQARIVELVSRAAIRSQTELAELLRAEGYPVTQGTLSRDLNDVGAVRVRGRDGDLYYAVTAASDSHQFVRARDRLQRLCAEFLLGAEVSANLVVAKTPPGAAPYLAAAIDKAGWETVVGTIAGDDCILIVSRDPFGGATLADELLGMGQGRKVSDAGV